MYKHFVIGTYICLRLFHRLFMILYIMFSLTLTVIIIINQATTLQYIHTRLFRYTIPRYRLYNFGQQFVNMREYTKKYQIMAV